MMRTDSPIEVDFLAALSAVGGDRIKFMPSATERQLRNAAMADEAGNSVFVSSQVPVRLGDRSYRADFLMAAYFSAVSPRVVCVECDGRDFHNADKDRNRDRAFMLAGIDTVRFSGSRLRDGFRCAIEALKAFGPVHDDPMSLGAALAGALTNTTTQYVCHAHGEDVPRENFNEAQA